MLSDESTQYLFVFRAFLFNERVKTRDPVIEALIEAINRELARRRTAMAGSIR
jgi:hypothetical protein